MFIRIFLEKWECYLYFLSVFMEFRIIVVSEFGKCRFFMIKEFLLFFMIKGVVYMIVIDVDG